MTSASAEFQIDPEQIRAHASSVAAAAGELSSSASGLPEGPPEAALGTFVQFLTAGLGAAMSGTAQAIAQASSAMDAVSGALVQTAEDYQRADDDNAVLLGKDLS